MKSIKYQMVNRRRFLLLGLFSLHFAHSARKAEAGEVRLPTGEAQACITCRFWGGRRQVSADGNWITADGTGTCDNPRSPLFARQTRPDEGSLVWRRWERLGPKRG